MIVGPSTVLNVSSSGLIYAGIVGAWAVYLVPVWLRREEQLNEAREKARYAAAIRTLGRSERFEKKVLAEESLAATGTDGAPPPRAGDERIGTAAKRPVRKPASAQAPVTQAPVTQTLSTNPPKANAAAAAQGRKSVTARLPHHQEKPAAKPVPSKAATAARRRGVLLMRRRRVVAFLFTLASLGAVVSAVMGLSYSWAMIAPATLFSAYIVYIRRDERQRARERYRRRQAALAAERRRERERQRLEQAAAEPAVSVAQPVVTEPDRSVWRPAAAPPEYRRAANG
jgi:hypothetical protein